MDNRLFRTQEEIVAFDDALDRLKANRDETLLPGLYLVFDDEADLIDPLDSLLNFIESFRAEAVVTSLALVTPILIEQSPAWLKSIYVGTLANHDRREELRKLLPAARLDVQIAIRQTLEQMKVDEGYGGGDIPQLVSYIEYVLDH